MYNRVTFVIELLAEIRFCNIVLLRFKALEPILSYIGTIKSGFKSVLSQLNFEFAAFFLAQLVQKKSGKFKIKLWRNWLTNPGFIV